MPVNIVDVQDIKGFFVRHQISAHDSCIIHNPPSGSYSNCVIKINTIMVSRAAATLVQAVNRVSLYLKRGSLSSTTKYYIGKDILCSENSSDYWLTEEVTLIDTPFYLDQGDSLWVVDGTSANFDTVQFDIVVSGEKLSDQATIVHDEDMGVTQGGKVNILAKREVDEDQDINFYLYGKPSTTYDVTLSAGSIAGAGLVTSDFNTTNGAVVPPSIPWNTTITTNASGVGNILLHTTPDVSTGEGDESVKLELDNNDRASAEVLIKDTSQGVVNVTVTGRMSRYGSQIGEIRWFIVDSSGNILHTLTNFSFGTYNSSMGGYGTSGYRNSWTDTSLNQKTQTVSMTPGTTWHLVVQHVRWGYYDADLAVDTIEFNNGNSGLTTYTFDPSNEGWQMWNGSRSTSFSSAFSSRSSLGNGYYEGWMRDASGTPSYSTGPTSAHSGSYYVYTETSYNNNNSTGRRYQLISPAQTA